MTDVPPEPGIALGPDQRAVRACAIDLAKAASVLRDADDELVALGHRLRAHDHQDGANGTEALAAVRAVSLAFQHMRELEARFQMMGGSTS
jgi:hypothetical protein